MRVCRFDKDCLERVNVINEQLADEPETDLYFWHSEPTLENNKVPDFVLVRRLDTGEVELTFPVEGKVSPLL